MKSYEVTIQVTFRIESAEDETDAAEQAMFSVSMCPDEPYNIRTESIEEVR